MCPLILMNSIFNDDQQRIEAVKQLKILDTESEPDFDDAVEFLGTLCETPYVVLTMLDTDRLWFKSQIGFDICEVDRKISMCNHTLQINEPLEVEDARLHDVFKNNPMVTGELSIRFYSGLPLKLDGNTTVGTLCVLDNKPRILNQHQKNGLVLMAKQIVHLLESRRHKILAELEVQKNQNLAQKFNSLYNSIEDGVVECTVPDGRFIDCSPAFCKMVGYSSDELHKMSVFDVTPEHAHAMSEKKLAGILAMPNEVGTFEKEYRHKSGRIIPALVKVFKVEDPFEETPRAWAQIKDLSSQKKKEEQRAQRKKMESLGTLSGGIAHDFNNILAIISGSAELIRLVNPSSNIENYLEKISSSAKRGAELVNRILAFSRKNSKPPEPLNIKFAVEQALQLISPTIPTTISLINHIEDNAVIDAVDSNITQIMMNLISNACQAIEPDSGKITVSLFKQIQNMQTVIVLSVSDSGSGMSEQQLSQAFDPFYTTKDKGRGTGLGLAIVHGLVEDMHGTITVESKEQQGTCFAIRFPLSKIACSNPTQNQVNQHSGGYNILLVEDETDIAELYKESLQNDGHTVTVESNGLKGLERAQKSLYEFDLLVTDDQMPELRGIELAKKLRSLKPDFPIVLLTGFVSKYVEKALEVGDIDKYLAKPVSLNELRDNINQLLLSVN